MDINRKNMDALFIGFKQQFKNNLEAAKTAVPVESIATIVPSQTAIESYPFLTQQGGMREWLNDRQIKNIESKKLEVRNRTFESTLSIERENVEDDQLAIYSNTVSELAMNSARLWYELMIEALVSDPNWLDDAKFFGTTRKYGTATIANKTNAALSETSFNLAYQTMMDYKGHGGKGLGIVPNILYVGAKNRTTAWNILKNQFAYDAADKVQIRNVNEGLCDMAVLPELTGDYDDYWFLACTTRALKPVIVQKRKEPNLVRLDREEDENVFMQRKFIYGVDARGAAALTMPHLIYAGML